jgi:multiple sugar transport system permease protein
MASSLALRKPKKAKLEKNWVGLLFFLPFFILFIVFTIAPVLVAMGLSLTNYNMIQTPDFSGITNYKLLFLDDDIFILSLKNTFTFAIITGPVGYLMSFVSAWVINNLKFKTGFALAFYIPSITSGVAMSVIWLVVFSPDKYGYLNNFLINLGLISEPIAWTQDPTQLMTVIVIIQIWMSMGGGFLVFLAGIQNLNRELLESGKIDGIKTKFQELQYIILPSMKPQLLYGAITSVTGALGVYDIAVAVAGFPSPNYAVHTIVAHLYDYAFVRFQMGYASAIAVVLFAMTFIIGKIIMRVLRSE